MKTLVDDEKEGLGYLGSGGRITGGSVGSSWKIKVFFFGVVLLHLVDLINFHRHGANFITWMIIYLFIALLAAPFFLEENFFRAYEDRRVLIYLGVSALAWFLPIIIAYLPDRVKSLWVTGLVVLLSAPWMAYVMFAHGGDDSLIGIFRAVWMIFWLVLMFATVVMSMVKVTPPSSLMKGYQIKPFEALSDAWAYMSDAFRKMFEHFRLIPHSIGAFVNRNLNDSIGYSFQGEVDPYAERDLGIRFTEVKTFRDSFNVGEPVSAWAYFQGENFKDNIELALRCYAKRQDGMIFNGTIKTQGDNGRIILRMREKLSASCEFDSLPRGYYQIWFVGLFHFETWGYIQYYFSPSDVVMDLWQQDRDPAQEARIPKRPVAVYTAGPIMLGLASEQDQPIPINVEDPDRTLPPFGASIINNWPEGMVKNVRHITLFVPEPFHLRDCDHTPMEGSREEPRFMISDRMEGYKEYSFSVDGDANTNFQSVMCFLSVDEPQEAFVEQLLGGFDLVTRTFAAKTNYVYEIKRSVRVKVQ